MRSLFLFFACGWFDVNECWFSQAVRERVTFGDATHMKIWDQRDKTLLIWFPFSCVYFYIHMYKNSLIPPYLGLYHSFHFSWSTWDFQTNFNTLWMIYPCGRLWGGRGWEWGLQQKISPAHRPKRALNASSVTPPPFTSIKKSFMFCCTTMMSTMSLSICSSAIHRMEKLSITPLKNFCSFFCKKYRK